MEISNEDASLDGKLAMCWTFFIYFTDATQDAVIMQYSNFNGTDGFKLLLQNKKMTAAFYNNLGSAYSFTSSFELTAFEWNHIGINFNYLWDDQFDFFEVSQSDDVTTNSYSIQSQTTIAAEGSLRFGISEDNNKPFSGLISCIQFYNTSIIGGTQKDLKELCDPSLWSIGFTSK